MTLYCIGRKSTLFSTLSFNPLFIVGRSGFFSLSLEMGNSKKNYMIDIILLHASHAKIQASRFSNFHKETSVCKIKLMSKIWLNWYWRQVWDYGAELREWSLTSLSVTSVSKLCHQDNYVTNINVSSIYRLFKLHETSDGLGNNCPGWLLIWPRNQPT